MPLLDQMGHFHVNVNKLNQQFTVNAAAATATFVVCLSDRETEKEIKITQTLHAVHSVQFTCHISSNKWSITVHFTRSIQAHAHTQTLAQHMGMKSISQKFISIGSYFMRRIKFEKVEKNIRSF